MAVESLFEDLDSENEDVDDEGEEVPFIGFT